VKNATKAALLGALSLAAYGKYREKTGQTSLMSQLCYQIMKRSDNSSEMTQEYIEKMRIENQKAYQIPRLAHDLYLFNYHPKFSDTLEYLPRKIKNDETNVLFFLHGGAYWFQPHPVLTYRFLEKIGRRGNIRIVMPMYPKAPTHTPMDMQEMVLERYLHLVYKEGVAPENITIMGSSAGGGLALAFLQNLRDNNYPLPKRGILFTPWLDLTPDLIPVKEQLQPLDPFLEVYSLDFLGRVFAESVGVESALASPVKGDLTGLCPVDVFSGTYDILHADSKEYEMHAQNVHAPVTFHYFDKMLHDFIMFPTREAREVSKMIQTMINER
jgi:acetyl esterase/lipase